MESDTSKQVKRTPPNPTGKGGFKENPQNINPGGRPKNVQRYDYWLQFFKDMSVEDFKKYARERKESEMYVAEMQAMQRISDSMKDFNVWQVIANRTEGKPAQAVDLTSGGEKMSGATIVFAKNPPAED